MDAWSIERNWFRPVEQRQLPVSGHVSDEPQVSRAVSADLKTLRPSARIWILENSFGEACGRNGTMKSAVNAPAHSAALIAVRFKHS
jgi:hypothetical protein